MPVKIRLQRMGRKKRPFYQIVIADSRSSRDGKFIERIGSYNPLTVPATIEISVDRAIEWLNKGAQPSDTAHRILSFKGVLYKKHLQRGVAKNLFSAEEADKKFEAFMIAREAANSVKKEAHSNTKKDAAAKQREAVAAKKAAEAEAKLAAAAEAETAAAEAAAAAEAPATEAPSADAAPEAPAAE